MWLPALVFPKAMVWGRLPWKSSKHQCQKWVTYARHFCLMGLQLLAAHTSLRHCSWEYSKLQKLQTPKTPHFDRLQKFKNELPVATTKVTQSLPWSLQPGRHSRWHRCLDHRPQEKKFNRAHRAGAKVLHHKHLWGPHPEEQHRSVFPLWSKLCDCLFFTTMPRAGHQTGTEPNRTQIFTLGTELQRDQKEMSR